MPESEPVPTASAPKPPPTRWYHHVAYCFGGAFLANALPHFLNGISGHPFQSPFASPPGEGLSSSTVNVLWGAFNLAVGYLLVCRVGRFDLRRTTHVVPVALGVLLMAVLLARAFGRFYDGALRVRAPRDAHVSCGLRRALATCERPSENCETARTFARDPSQDRPRYGAIASSVAGR
jgi:hypothetical protein